MKKLKNLAAPNPIVYLRKECEAAVLKLSEARVKMIEAEKQVSILRERTEYLQNKLYRLEQQRKGGTL